MCHNYVLVIHCYGIVCVRFGSIYFNLQWEDLEGGPSRLRPPPLWATDWRRHSQLCQVMLNFDRFTVKHGTRSIQNDRHQWISDSFKVYRIRFRLGLCPGPHWGSLQCSPWPSSWFKVPNRRGEEGDGRDPPLRKFLDPPLITRILFYWQHGMRVFRFI